MADDDSTTTCHTAISLDSGDVIGLMVTTDGEYFVSSLMQLKNFPDGDEHTLADEQYLIADFEMIKSDHFILAEATGKIIEVIGGRASETADLDTILTGIHAAADARLYAYGLGGRVFRLEGQSWQMLPLLRSDVFCVRATPEGTLYACGSNGLFARFAAGAWAVLELGTNIDLQSILVREDQSVLVCGMSGFAGLWANETWTIWEVPAADYYDLALFMGNIFVGAGSDGLYFVKGNTFKKLKKNIFSYSLRSSMKYLAISGNNEIVRYDGKEYPCLEFNYDLEDD